jgi:hypothetical protein
VLDDFLQGLHAQLAGLGGIELWLGRQNPLLPGNMDNGSADASLHTGWRRLSLLAMDAA